MMGGGAAFATRFSAIFFLGIGHEEHSPEHWTIHWDRAS